MHHVFLSPSVTASDGDTEVPEVILYDRTGLLAEEREADGLASHLRWLTEHPDRWSDLTAVARARVQTEFDARTQGERLAKAYKGVMDER